MIKNFLIISFAIILAACSKQHKIPLSFSSNDVIVAFGDSLTFGYGASPQKSYPDILQSLINIKIVNMGQNGATTADSISRLDDVLEHNPKLVLVSLGGNDMLRKYSDSSIVNNLSIIIKTLKQKKIEVILIAQPRPSAVGVYITGLTDADFYEKIAKEEKIPLISQAFSKPLSKDNLKSDLIHLNNEGYQLVAYDIHKQIQKYYKIEK